MIVVTLPKTLPSAEAFDLLVAKYKSFRLLSLTSSPEAFGSTYASEVAFPSDKWVSRVSNPLAANIIAVSSSASASPRSELNLDNVDRILEGEWLASLTLVGPLDKDGAAKAFEDNTHFDPEIALAGATKLFFILNAMYVLPSARGGGLGVALVEYGLKVASEVASGEPVRVLLVVDHENEAARRLYERGGFSTIQRYWFDDYREGRADSTEAAVMKADLNRDY